MWNPVPQCRMAKSSRKSWTLFISNQTHTSESRFLRASMFWLYKYQPSPLLSLWMSMFTAERERQRASYWHHKTPSLSHWSSFIHWLTGLGTSSLYQSETRGFREVVTAPEKTQSNVFISICQVNRLEVLAADVHWEIFFSNTYVCALKVNW